ncbi:cytidine deaminase [Gluconobacter cerinus]|uniref:cytidine deaminase n=1 Tax=Gluconobacter cerinus TaxID=38307 RepID=UPI001B8CF84E|nr:cytidine deaminase [Gluconobacter cerinus]MBS1070517.1 cytidine deaminase [Gluconobacter cerinus]
MMEELISRALEARSRAYAPYSRFQVGAALRCEGVVHSGCNVENAAYPLGTCAEGGAISAMILAGGRRIEEIVIVGGGDQPCTPCGGCRQKLREFGLRDLKVHMISPTGTLLLTRTLAELLPDAFGPDNLE